LYGIIWLIFWA